MYHGLYKHMDKQPTQAAIILASSSRYRRELLQRLGIDFSCRSPSLDETPGDGEDPEQMVKRLAAAKAGAIADGVFQGLIIGADQAAVMGGRIIGKPGNHAAARLQLQQASNNELLFLTGISLLNTVSGHLQVDCVPCKVRFRNLSDDQINRYLERERPFDCAGAFKSEGLGIALIEAMDTTDPTALIGLPLIRLRQMLEAEGVAVI